MLISLAPGGRVEVDRIAIELRAINDRFFGALDGKSFAALSAAAAALVQSSAGALDYVYATKGRAGSPLRATA